MSSHGSPLPAEAPGSAGRSAVGETLAASLAVVHPSLPQGLFDGDALDELTHLAAALAPLHCAGFEARLDADRTVDLLQRIAAARGEPERLARHIEASGLSSDPVWRRLAAFCRDWSCPQSLLHRCVSAAFLGFDAAAATRGRPIPSLYLSLEPGDGVQQELMDLIAAAATMLRGAPLSPATMAAVAACRAALPAGATVADLGFMLARPVDALRLVVARLPRLQAAGYLASLPWAGPPPDVTAAERLVPAVLPHVILSLDVAAGVLPRIGFEYDPGYAEAALPVWREALDALVTVGLCGAAKHDALLRWPGHLEPIDDVDPPWPGSLLQESLLNRSDEFLVLALRLTFLKLVCDEQGVRQAKAYFGYGPRSFAPERGDVADDGLDQAIAPGRRPLATSAGPGLRIEGAPSPATIEAAWRSGACFLTERRDAEGMWLEFPRVLGGTDEWATAYVAEALAHLPDERARHAAVDAWRALCGKRTAGEGWGYNAELPIDADSTLWALRLAGALGRDGEPRARAARDVLEAHRIAGGVATYAPAAEPGLRRLLGDADLSGMFVAHPCVTAAAAAPAALGAGVAAGLPDLQEPDGRWRGYWWSDDEYTTWLAVEALAGTEVPGAVAAVRHARRWARDRFDRGRQVWSRDLAAPSPFAGALCLAIVFAGDAAGGTEDDKVFAAAAIDTLLAMQEPDGGWPAAALMRMPPTDAAHGDARPAQTAVSTDDRRLFTTATVLRTLAAAQRVLHLPPGSSRLEAL